MHPLAIDPIEYTEKLGSYNIHECMENEAKLMKMPS